MENNFIPKTTPLKLAAFILRWAARLSAALLLGMVLVIVIGEGVLGGGGPNFAKMNWAVRCMFAAEFVAILGLAVIWWRELLGGLLVIGGIIAFSCLNYLESGQLLTEGFEIFYIPGLLAILAWILTRIEKAKNSQISL